MRSELPEEAVGQGNEQENATGEGTGQRPDPNREPGGDALDNEDVQGGVFYDKNTETRRETEFHDATGAPLVDENRKVKPDNDQFGKQKP